MPKIRKVKRRKTYKANINRKRLRNKLRKLPDIGCKDIKTVWENTKSTRHNLGDMGLAYDPNEALKIPKAKREQMILGNSSESEDEKEVKRVPPKAHVALNLEAEAKAPRERLFRLPNQQVLFVTYLMDKYGDDYKAMTRDKKNYYQMTWRQIRAKINTFKGVPEQYAEYLLKKGDIVLDDPMTLEETRKRIAEENVKKFCVPKPKKVKPAKPRWQKELAEEMEFDTEDKLEDINDEKTDDESGEPEKKLQLFSDDDNDDREDESKSKLKKSRAKTEPGKNGRVTKRSVECNVEINKTKETVDKKTKALEISLSSDSESDQELEEDEDEAEFVDLNELSDEELSEDDILDNGEFVTDTDESD